jgi:hypothetical protein
VKECKEGEPSHSVIALITSASDYNDMSTKKKMKGIKRGRGYHPKGMLESPLKRDT